MKELRSYVSPYDMPKTCAYEGPYRPDSHIRFPLAVFAVCAIIGIVYVYI